MPSWTSSIAKGPSTPLSTDNLFDFCFGNPFQHTPNEYAPKSIGIRPAHTFDGQIIPPQRPSLIHAGTGATVSWQRVRADSLRVARYLRAIIGDELLWDGKSREVPIHSPHTTVLLHLPNCLVFPMLLLGGLASLYTVTPVSTLLTSNELANILAKAKPQVLITSVGSEGEERLRSALELILERPEKHTRFSSVEKIKEWARNLAVCWDSGRKGKHQKASKVPLREQRIWTVNLSSRGGADYYGSSSRDDGVSTLADPRDWSNMLTPPSGHKHDGSSDTISREAFLTRKLSEEEQSVRVALLLWSSGTTGDSKGVLLSHRNVVASISGHWIACPQLSGTSRGLGETWVTLAPWCHTYGLVTLLLPSFAIGVTLVIPTSPKFDLEKYLRLVTHYRATTLHLAPPVAVALRSTPLLDRHSSIGKEIDLSSVKTLVSGGAAIPTEVIKIIYNRLGKMLQIGYGTTETGSNAHSIAQEFNISNPHTLYELGSVGHPHANLEICIRPSPDATSDEIEKRYQEVIEQGKMKRKNGDCAPMNPSLPGEIHIRGPQIMLGYYSGQGSDEGNGARDEKLTSDAMTKDGYYRSGDEGLLDEHGRLWIIGRTKELIKVRGFQVPPIELDSIFAQHHEISEAAAAGINEGDEGEQVVMYVVPRDSNVLKDKQHQARLADHLADFVADKAAFYKWPRYYVFVPSLIKNASGKILRKNLHHLSGTRHRAPRRDRASKI